MLKSLVVLIALALTVPITVLAAGSGEPAANAARTLGAPSLDGPADDANVQSAPIFRWHQVRRAAKYEFQLAADPEFRSIVTGGTVDTNNNAYTLEDALADGDYYWRVRGVSAKDDAGAWSRRRTFKKRWSTRPTLLSPTDERVVNYPSDPFVLRWEPVPGAVKYVVTLAADPALATQVLGTAANPIETVGTALTPPGSLEPGQYWWAITPVDAAGHRGTRSAIGSFVWRWPSSSSLHVENLSGVAHEYEPRFSWDRVPGADNYEVEVNSAEDFAPGSKVCCSDEAIGTSLAPSKVFPNNRYYWRVRAVDPNGVSGQWNYGPTFDKSFYPSVTNLRLRDNHGSIAVGSTTDSPIVAWDPVPGAASYDVQVLPYVTPSGAAGPICDGGHPFSKGATSSTAWTPLASGGNSPIFQRAATTGPMFQAGASYCVAVRARAAVSVGERVTSDWTYLRSSDLPAFTYSAHDPGTTAAPVTADDYLTPTPGAVGPRMPLFTWEHIAGACGYFIVVAKDESFTTVIDVARTRIPAYAPRDGGSPVAYPDESTSYYWAVVPVVGSACTSHSNALNAPQNFRKDSVAPTPSTPGEGADVTNQPTFRWSAAEGARDYRLQVALDPTFLSVVDDVVTSSTSYTSESTYPADAVLYWRVRANADSSPAVGLNWSATRTFRRRLLSPAVGANPDADERVPVFSWDPVPGAISYDLSIEEPDGGTDSWSNFRSVAAAPIKAYGLGTWQWRVRANFPSERGRDTAGPFSARRSFTRFMNPPTGARIARENGALVLDWDPSFGLAKRYQVEFSDTTSFRRRLESRRVDNAGYAPTMTSTGFQDGGPIYWRVAAVDEGNNVGGWATGRVGLLRRMVVTTRGGLLRGARGRLHVSVTNVKGRAVKGARVTLRGVGVRARKYTSRRGAVSFRVRPKARGTLRVRVDKSGFRPGSAALSIH